ncbi:MAG TPA: phosphonate metabolism protein/1,5-bisphosphokinase (PRPP-forming) PhnN [Magnetospirillaceae bacterium]|jgi:phosphonate metabolism protein PhnN/1,5-bisphosphokinase (PRPP-forming)
MTAEATETKLGPLILVVGPSGAGKDTLIDGAKHAFADDPSIHFVRRLITRAIPSGEDHDTLTAIEFEAMERAGSFLLHWHAHGLSYGIPITAQDRRREGAAVIANVSRTVVDHARRRLAPVRVIVVTAPPKVLAARLKDRGRESVQDAAKRLAKAAEAMPSGPDVIDVINDSTLAAGQAAFIAALEKMRR